MLVLLALALPVPTVGIGAPASAEGPRTQPKIGPTNWVLAKVTTRFPTKFHVDFAVRGRSTGRGPLVTGFGIAWRGGPDLGSWLLVESQGGGATAVAVGAGSQRHRMTFPNVQQGRGAFADSVLWDFKASTLAFLFFAANGVIEEVRWRPSAEGVRFRSSLRRGTGATALLARAPSNGVTAAAASAAAGFAEYTRVVPTGIVGGMEWLSCRACAGSWTPPGSARRIWTTAGHNGPSVCFCPTEIPLNTTFAGGAGTWSWSWAGLTGPPGSDLEPGLGALPEPAVAAYAPIGRDWRLFGDCQVACVTVPV